MCTLCADQTMRADQARILHLLAVLEEPDALPAALALRLGQEIWMSTRQSSMTCEAVSASEAAHG